MVRALAGVVLSAFLSAPVMAAATEAAPSFEAADVHASPYRRFGDGSGANSSGTSAAPDPNGAVTLFDASASSWG